MHLPALHLPLVASPDNRLLRILRCEEHTPSVGLILSPLSIIFDLTVGEVELPLSVHHVILPPSFIVTTIMVDISPLPMLQIILFPTDVLVTICVLLMQINDLLLLLLSLQYVHSCAAELTLS